MYPAKILDYAESYIPDFLDIEVSNIIFTVQSLSGKLQIEINFVVTGIAPSYECRTYNRTYVKISPNVSVTVKRLTLLNSASGQIYYDFNGTMYIEKDGEAIFNVYNSNNNTNYQSGRVIKAVYQSDERGTFFRVYSANSMPINNQWSDPKPIQVTFD